MGGVELRKDEIYTILQIDKNGLFRALSSGPLIAILLTLTACRANPRAFLRTICKIVQENGRNMLKKNSSLNLNTTTVHRGTGLKVQSSIINL